MRENFEAATISGSHQSSSKLVSLQDMVSFGDLVKNERSNSLDSFPKADDIFASRTIRICSDGTKSTDGGKDCDQG